MRDIRVTARSLYLSGGDGGNLEDLLGWPPFKRQELPEAVLDGVLGDLPNLAKSEQRDQLRALSRLLPLNFEGDFNQLLKELSHPWQTQGD